MSCAGGVVADDGFADVRLTGLPLGVGVAGLRGLATGFAAGIFIPGIEPWSIPDMVWASAGELAPSEAIRAKATTRLTRPHRADEH